MFSRIFFWKKAVSGIMAFVFAMGTFPTPGVGQVLPVPGSMVALSTSFAPPVLKGVKVYADDPFRLDFILDKGDFKEGETSDVRRQTSDGALGADADPGSTLEKAGTSWPFTSDVQRPTSDLKVESTRLIKYFLAAVTVPENDLWVNLSPYEKDRIIPDAFGQTGMGRDLLAQDYMLKQITASVIYPEGEIGKAFWAKVYAEARKRYGTTDIPVDTFNKVWIVPEKAVVFESKDSAYVVESRLRVMLETDYLALEKSDVGRQTSDEKGESRPTASDVSPLSSDPASAQASSSTQVLTRDILREVVIPVLEKEVNEGANFARLRQVYHSLILANWYKDKVKESIFGKAYADRKKVEGLEYEKSDVGRQTSDEKGVSRPATSDVSRLSSDPEGIWQLYVEAFKKGAYNYIKEECEQGAGSGEQGNGSGVNGDNSLLHAPVSMPGAPCSIVPRKYFSGGVKFGDVARVKSPATLSQLPQGTSERAMSVQIRLDPSGQGKADSKKDEALFSAGRVSYGQGRYIARHTDRRQPFRSWLSLARSLFHSYDSEFLGLSEEGISPGRFVDRQAIITGLRDGLGENIAQILRMRSREISRRLGVMRDAVAERKADVFMDSGHGLNQLSWSKEPELEGVYTQMRVALRIVTDRGISDETSGVILKALGEAERRLGILDDLGVLFDRYQKEYVSQRDPEKKHSINEARQNAFEKAIGMGGLAAAEDQVPRLILLFYQLVYVSAREHPEFFKALNVRIHHRPLLDPGSAGSRSWSGIDAFASDELLAPAVVREAWSRFLSARPLPAEAQAGRDDLSERAMKGGEEISLKKVERFLQNGEYGAGFSPTGEKILRIGIGKDVQGKFVHFEVQPVSSTDAVFRILYPEEAPEEHPILVGKGYVVASSQDKEEKIDADELFLVPDQYISAGKHFAFQLLHEDGKYSFIVLDYGSSNGTNLSAEIDLRTIMYPERQDILERFDQELDYIASKDQQVGEPLIDEYERGEDFERFKSMLDRAADLYMESYQFPELRHKRKKILGQYFIVNMVGHSKERQAYAFDWLKIFCEDERRDVFTPVFEIAVDYVLHWDPLEELLKAELLKKEDQWRIPVWLRKKMKTNLAKKAGSTQPVFDPRKTMQMKNMTQMLAGLKRDPRKEPGESAMAALAAATQARSPHEEERLSAALSALMRIDRPVRTLFVMPMYKEMQRLGPKSDENPFGEDALRVKVAQFVAQQRANPKFEWRLLAMDDGTPEEASARLLEKIWKEIREEYQQAGMTLDPDLVQVLSISEDEKSRTGSRKGYATVKALKQAVSDGWADYIGYTDTDISTNVMQTPLMLEALMNGGADAAIGSRWASGGEGQVTLARRYFSSRVFNLMIRTLLPPLAGIRDTQRGFKLFSREILGVVLDNVRDPGMSFDTELLLLTKLSGGKVEEVPISWFDSAEASTVTLGDEAKRMAKGILKYQTPHLLDRVLIHRLRMERSMMAREEASDVRRQTSDGNSDSTTAGDGAQRAELDERAIDRRPDQMALVKSGVPLEFGPGSLYHLGESLDSVIEQGVVPSGEDGVFLTRVPHKFLHFNFVRRADSPFIARVSTETFNALADKRRARLERWGGDPGQGILDPYPRVLEPLSIDDIEEIWVGPKVWERYQDILRGEKGSEELRDRLRLLIDGGKLRLVEELAPIRGWIPERERIEAYLVSRGLQKEIPALRPGQNMGQAAGLDSAMNADKGGIDLTRNRIDAVFSSNSGPGTRFQFDAAQLERLQNAPGLVPVIIDIQPMTGSVPEFLGV